MKKLIYFVGAMIIALSCEQIQDPIEEVNNTSRLSVTARFETADTKVAFSEASSHGLSAYKNRMSFDIRPIFLR